MKIVITTMGNLPEYCHDCPCCRDGYCKADKEQREAQPYRPYWCPLREEKEEQATPVDLYIRYRTVNQRKRSLCDMCGKVVLRDALTTINDNLHVCKDCKQWLRDHCTKTEKEQLHIL